ncbi:MAG: HAD-IA family hydrolase [Hyphomicrobiales bacterium]|nr:HAD-IA family hydrolase [Hyphomicrobiales bacterium]MCP5373924.1 HAD-IA family hydrolase [Hyphomicrobiales bacterium]
MSDRLRLAVFDCDGTLVDSQHSIYAALCAACELYKFPTPTRDVARRVVGLPLLDAIARVVPDAGAEDLENLRQAYSASFFALRQSGGLQEPLFPGTEEGLRAFDDAGWLLGVATGKSRRGLLATLGGHGLLDRFVTLQTSDSVPAGKPAPDMLLAAMAEAGTNPEDTVMIGDTTFDVEMAVNAGVVAIGVAWGYHNGNELIEAGAREVVETFGDLARVVGETWET